ncbi:MAG TPA: hypothetical protein VIY73_05750 [Polyangiaceae bacterium]
MPPAPPTMTFQQLMVALIETLHVNSVGLAQVLGVSPRTITRYWKRGGSLAPSTAAELARHVHPLNRALAVELAAHSGRTLVELGIEAPPAPPAPPPATPPAPRAPAVLHRHVVDAVVAVAAEAMQATPQAVRGAVMAAFERAVALGMTAEEVLAAMAPAAPSAPAKAARAATKA